MLFTIEILTLRFSKSVKSDETSPLLLIDGSQRQNALHYMHLMLPVSSMNGSSIQLHTSYRQDCVQATACPDCVSVRAQNHYCLVSCTIL